MCQYQNNEAILIVLKKALKTTTKGAASEWPMGVCGCYEFVWIDGTGLCELTSYLQVTISELM